jgi:threonine/homoserine/homoserine lactone efflux protein
MISSTSFLVFVGAALLMAITPGPNMVYLVSRSLCQGRAAGVTSWLGVVLGFTFHMLCAAIGLTALFMAVPLGYEPLKFAGAFYLLWLAWQAVRPGSRSPFEARDLPAEPPRKLVVMGLLSAAGIAGWFAKNRFWLAVQRYVMGLVLGALAFKLLSQQRSAA